MSEEVMRLNDSLRQTFRGGRVEFAPSAALLSAESRSKIKEKLRQLSPNVDCVMSANHNSGTFNVSPYICSFTIGYYARPRATVNFDDVFRPVSLTPAADPGDAAATLRILTIAVQNRTLA